MNLQVEPLESHEVRMTISVDDAIYNKARKDVVREMSKQVRIPGFRPGMAPEATVLQFVGPDYFASELADRIAREVYPKAIDEANIQPYAAGAIEDIKQSPFQLIVKIPLEPTVDLKDYKSIRLPFPAITVEDKEIDDQIQAIREDNAIVEMAERPAELGDMIEGTILGTMPDTNEAVFSSNNRRGFVLDETRMGIPGLAALVVGTSAGEHKDTTLTLPEDFEAEALRGKTINVTIDITRVSSRALPEANDELAQTVGSFNTLADLRADLVKRLTDYKTQQANRTFADQSLDAFTALAGVQMPPAFIEDRLNDLLADMKDDVRENEGMPFEDWLKLQNKTEEQWREEYRELAKTRGAKGLVMRELGAIEKIAVTDSEIAAEVETTAARYGNRQKEVRRLLAQNETRSTVKNNILSNKVLIRMMDIAKGNGDLPAESATPVSETDSPAQTSN